VQLIPIEIIKANQQKLDEIDHYVKSIYRLIIYSRHHTDDDLLDCYLNGIHTLTDQLSMKNAQMEAQNEEEAEEYLKNLRITLDFVLEEIIDHKNFEQELQLFQLLRYISPETNAIHPNRYRTSHVQVGAHLCPDPSSISALVSELFYKIKSIPNPIIRAIYFHHELIRIHPFLDGNGRVTRIAKNWMLMYHLYPPIFISDAPQKLEYINTLSNSFKSLEKKLEWNEHTESFFEQELDRLITNSSLLFQNIEQAGQLRVDKS
jgi:Fic family protein